MPRHERKNSGANRSFSAVSYWAGVCAGVSPRAGCGITRYHVANNAAGPNVFEMHEVIQGPKRTDYLL
jgi:hypothetical protein